MVTPSAKRQAIEVLAAAHRLPIQHACHIVRLSRAAYYRPPVPASRRDAAVIAALMNVVARYPRWGFWKCYDRLRLDGAVWNHKRVHRVYCALRLNLPRRTKRRVPYRVHQPLLAPPVLNQTWALDFMADALYDRRRFRALTILDEGNREGLAIDIGRSIPARRVIRVLEELIALHGRPGALRLDNGPELTAQVFVDWCDERRIALHYIQPGKPDQNAFIERFNRSYRTEVLDAYLFESLAEVRAVTDRWLVTYNQERPHDSLGRVPPLTFLPRPTTAGQSLFQCLLDGEAYGGTAAATGFTVNTGNNIVLGFSFAGATIPAGNGVLVVLEVAGSGDARLTDLVISDSSGDALGASVEDCLTISVP